MERDYSKDDEKQGRDIHHLPTNLASLETKVTNHNAIDVLQAQIAVSRATFVVDNQLTRVAFHCRPQHRGKAAPRL